MNKKMERFEVIHYGFNPTPQNDERLTVEGADFNDFNYGSGFSAAEAYQFAIDLILEEGVEPSKELLAEADDASAEEHPEFVTYNLAIRYYFDRTKEDAELMSRIEALIEEKRAKKAEAEERGEFVEDEDDILNVAG